MTAYYNEFDKYAAAWLRNLINDGLIAPGIVDDRSIEDVRPDDLEGFDQCHFFAGIGVWSYALRSAGWSDHRSVWTASCPCQPYSQAGEGRGFDDERHLWPHFEHLLRQQKRPPAIVLGEQVASSFAEPWIDLIHADLEALGYAFGCVPFPSAGVGAPHIRDRNYWMAYADDAGSFPGAHPGIHRGEEGAGSWDGESKRLGAAGGLAYADHAGLEGWGQSERERGNQRPAWQGGLVGRLADANSMRQQAPTLAEFHDAKHHAESCGGVRGMADPANIGQHGRRASIPCDGRDAPRFEPERLCDAGDRSGPTNGFWADADWLGCRDGKWRPVEPGTSPLAHGAAARVVRLRAYGNAVNAKAAEIFIRSAMLVID